MPPRSVLLNVFTTARGLGKPLPEESLREVRAEEENVNQNPEKLTSGNVEGREKSMHVKHDSTQPSPEGMLSRSVFPILCLCFNI